MEVLADSSISSFEMIIRSLLVCLFLAVAYSCVLPLLPPPSKGLQGGSQWEKNRIREESLVCQDRQFEVIVVGSSIAGTLNGLPDDWFNLSMASFSSIQGLEILCNSSAKPCLVLIETNVLSGSQYKTLGPVEVEIKRRLASARTGNKPAHSMLRLLGSTFGIRGDGVRVPQFQPDVPDSRTVSEEFFQNALQRRLKIVSQEIPADSLKSRLENVFNSVDTLMKRGFRFAFFLAPETPETFDTVGTKQLLAAYRGKFPPDQFVWFDDDVNAEMYASNDARHMTPQSALRFSKKLIEMAEGLISSDDRE